MITEIKAKARENDAHDEAKSEKICNFDVGCGISGKCYAKENGQPESCGKFKRQTTALLAEELVNSLDLYNASDYEANYD